MGCAGNKSVARRLLRTAAAQLANANAARDLGAAEDVSDIEEVLVAHSLQPQLESIAKLVVQPADSEAEARWACMTCVQAVPTPHLH